MKKDGFKFVGPTTVYSFMTAVGLVKDLLDMDYHGRVAQPCVGAERADLVLGSPAFFGVKPEMVLIGGSIVCAQMGDPNASIPTPQPVYSRAMFGAYGRAVESAAVIFTSAAAHADGVRGRLGLSKATVPVLNTRGIGKADMVMNTATPKIEVHPETYEVRADGVLLTCEPARSLPLAQRYFLY